MNPCTSSGAKTADGVIYAKPCLLHAVVLNTATTAAATAILYDNSSAASGTKVLTVAQQAGTSAQGLHQHFDAPIICNNGIYLDISGAGAECYVMYSPL